MSCERYRILMTGHVDKELASGEQAELMEHLQSCTSCAEELRQQQALKEITGDMQFIEPEDRVWNQYWSSVYNRMERRVAWLLLSIGVVLLLSYATFHVVEEMLLQDSLSWGLRIGVISLILGFYTLLASVFRERSAIRKSDRYEDIKR